MTWITITIAVPEVYVADANQLARTLGYGPSDENTFSSVAWRDNEGNLYSLSSGLVKETFPINAQSELIEPDWSSDLTAANRAQAILRVYDPELSSSPFANPFQICAVIGLNVQEALSILGLTPREELDEE